jgi:hypothetical protein
MCCADGVILTLKHGWTEITADTLDPLFVQWVDGYFFPPQVEEYFKCPPVSDGEMFSCRGFAGF